MVANVRQTDTWRRNRYLANGQTLGGGYSYLERLIDGQTHCGGIVIECSTDRVADKLSTHRAADT